MSPLLARLRNLHPGLYFFQAGVKVHGVFLIALCPIVPGSENHKEASLLSEGPANVQVVELQTVNTDRHAPGFVTHQVCTECYHLWFWYLARMQAS